MTSLEWIAVGALIVSSFLILLHHVLFPFFLKRQKNVISEKIPAVADAALPQICIIVPVYNEEFVIAAKVRNLASLIYPANKLSVVIACDGCTDDTAKVVRATASEDICSHLNLRVVVFSENRGKIAVLNDMLNVVNCPIICLSDASAWMSVDSLLRSAAHMADPHTGIVAGTYQLNCPASNGEATYWRYQRAIKEGEAALGSPLGVHGACYFMRKAALERLPADTINDDFVLPMQAVALGYKAVYDRHIVALETEPSSADMDFHRRCRIAAGNAQQAIRLSSLLHPRYKGIALAFLCGKALRVIIPYLIIVCFLGNLLVLSISGMFAFLLFSQIVVYAAAIARSLFVPEGRSRLLDLNHYLVVGHCANLIGSLRYLSGLENGCWKKLETSIPKETK